VGGNLNVSNLTSIDSDVNPRVFSRTEYEIISTHERGEVEFDYEVEQAYLKLMAAYEFRQPVPIDVPQEWWDEQARQWGRLEQYWKHGKVYGHTLE
jgi:uncharacterized protein YgiM (DUF1202 family)